MFLLNRIGLLFSFFGRRLLGGGIFLLFANTVVGGEGAVEPQFAIFEPQFTVVEPSISDDERRINELNDRGERASDDYYKALEAAENEVERLQSVISEYHGCGRYDRAIAELELIREKAVIDEIRKKVEATDYRIASYKSLKAKCEAKGNK